jgi:hypothetical protein
MVQRRLDRRRRSATAIVIALLVAVVTIIEQRPVAAFHDGPPSDLTDPQTPQVHRPEGGGAVRIYGEGFLGTTSVTIGGITVPDFRVVDGDLIIARVPPAGVPLNQNDGFAHIVVTDDQGSASTDLDGDGIVDLADCIGTNPGDPCHPFGPELGAIFYTDATLTASPSTGLDGGEMTTMTLTGHRPNQAGWPFTQLNPLVNFLEDGPEDPDTIPPGPAYGAPNGFVNTDGNGNVSQSVSVGAHPTFNAKDNGDYDTHATCPVNQVTANYGLDRCILGYSEFGMASVETYFSFSPDTPTLDPVPAAPTLSVTPASGAPGTTVTVSGANWNAAPHFGSDTTTDDPGESILIIELCNTALTACSPAGAPDAEVAVTRYFDSGADPDTQPVTQQYSGATISGTFRVDNTSGCAPSCRVRVRQQRYNIEGNIPFPADFITATANLTVAVTPPANADRVSDITKSAGSDTSYGVDGDLALFYNGSQGCEVYGATYGPAPDLEPNAPLTCAPNASQPSSSVVTENYDHDLITNYFPTGSTDGFRQLCRREAVSVQNIQFARSSSSPSVQAPNCTTANGGDSGTTFRWVTYAAENLGWSYWSGGHGVSNLSVAQLQGIFVTCSITNWSQLGGPNEPIRVFAPQVTSGSLATWEAMLGGNPTACIPAAFKDGNLANGERLVREHQAVEVEAIDTAAEAAGLVTCVGQPGCATADLERWSIFASFSCAVWTTSAAHRSASLMGSVAGNGCGSAAHPGKRNLYHVFAQTPGTGYPGTSTATRRFTDMTPTFPPANPTSNGWICMPLSKHSKPVGDPGPGTPFAGANRNYGLEKQAILQANGFTLHKDDPTYTPGGVTDPNDKPFCKQAQWIVNTLGNPMTFTGTNLGLPTGS